MELEKRYRSAVRILNRRFKKFHCIKCYDEIHVPLSFNLHNKNYHPTYCCDCVYDREHPGTYMPWKEVEGYQEQLNLNLEGAIESSSGFGDHKSGWRCCQG